MAVTEGTRGIVGGVDTHKDLHVAAVVDEQDRVIETRCFATARQGYRQMLAWMRSLGELKRIGIESTGSHHAFLAASSAQIGDRIAAGAHAREVIQREPAFGAKAFLDTLHYRQPSDAEHLHEGILLAGLPG
jgi:hypothetical protein